ncbi:MAG: ABC transporter substrate-binding protein [Anaerolineaceae bacterium]|nr:ABC transporter substrate-binding protein [Anaerolineaceae bacterium]
MKRSAAILVFLFLVMSLTSCLAQPTVNVGFAASMSGKNALMGIDGRDGALLAVDMINASRGTFEYHFNLVIEDDQGTRQGAQAADNEFLEAADVVAIIGHMTSTTALAGLDVAQPAGMVIISPTAATTQLSGREDLFFRMFSSADIEARLMARRIIQRGILSVGIILDEDNAAYTESVEAAFKEEYTALSGVIVAEAGFFSSENPDFRPLLQTIRESEPEALLIIAGAQDTGIICQHARMIDWDAPLFTARWGQSDTTIRDGGRAAEGLEAVVDFNPNETSPAYQEFLLKFRTRFNREPTFAALRSYEAVLFLAEALEKTDGKREGLDQALLAVGEMNGPAGVFHLDAYGDVVRPHFLLRVEDGHWITAESYQPGEGSRP